MLNIYGAANSNPEKYKRRLLQNGWTSEAVQKYEDAIKAERNTYGINQEVRYWQFAVLSTYYNRGVDNCIRMKELDVASDFKLLPSLFQAMNDVYDGVLNERIDT